MKSSLTILFEAPFWIGLYERIDGDRYEVCKITFGAEPKDYEVYDFLLQNWRTLKFSPPLKADRIEERKINPKRMQREINNQLQDRGIGTKAQQALKLQHEQKSGAAGSGKGTPVCFAAGKKESQAPREVIKYIYFRHTRKTARIMKK